MKDLVFVSVQPSDLYFTWQIDVQLNNFKKWGYDKLAHVLVFISNDKPAAHPRWAELEQKYPDTKFFYYKDRGNITNTFSRVGYIPLLRPYCLKEHFKAFPELKEKAIFYHDSDILFTKYLDFTPFLSDDVCYLSNTISYIGASYFDSKAKDVIPYKAQGYARLDVLDSCMKMFGLSREDAVKNESGSGGAQYLLKNIDYLFWNKVFDGCIIIKNHLGNVNKTYFESEDKGFQSWCADMWSVLWNLWAEGKQTECPSELDFAWATDPIDKWDKVYIYHDAGASSATPHLFHKRDVQYVNNISTPLDGEFNNVSNEYCSYNYVQAIKSLKQ